MRKQGGEVPENTNEFVGEELEDETHQCRVREGESKEVKSNTSAETWTISYLIYTVRERGSSSERNPSSRKEKARGEESLRAHKIELTGEDQNHGKELGGNPTI